MNEDSTNFWDALCVLFSISYHLVLIGTVGYAVQFWGWSPWWFLILTIVSIRIRTGRAAWRKREKSDTKN